MRDAIEDIEIRLLVEAIYYCYGYDFREYARPSQLRRLKDALSKYDFKNFSELQHHILHAPEFFSEFLSNFTITVSSFFRDAEVFKALRENLFPYLATRPQIKVWSAGCSTGEEIYSLCILLKEAGLLDSATIYASDINPLALEKAKKGVFDLSAVKKGSENYFAAGGNRSFNEYFITNNHAALILEEIREKVFFTEHNLVSDQSFGEMDLILCRNVMIYFNSDLQNKVISLLTSSLCRGGYLCVGNKETLSFSKDFHSYNEAFKSEKIYRKKVLL